jgi:hypothetical protein
MRRHQAISDGSQISDENLALRFHLPLSEVNLARLETLRELHDPHGLTHGFPRPVPAQPS